MMDYSWIRPRMHTITVRDRATGFAHQHRCWNQKVIEKVLAEQKQTEDIYITKYPSDMLVDTVILDFDSEDIKKAYADVNRMRNYLTKEGLNCIVVRSGSKGYHLYIQIAPFLFKDTEMRKGVDWKSYFNAFVCFLIHDSHSTYETLDKTNFNAGLNGNIRLIGSKHPKTGQVCEIIEGSFISEYKVTRIQDEAQKKAFLKCEIVEEDKKQKLKKAKIIRGNDPILANDLRDVFEQLVGEVKRYPKGYAYCRCPFHSDQSPSLLITKDWFSCSACNAKGNIWTLKKLKMVDFDDKGGYKLR